MPTNATIVFSFSGLPGGNEYCLTTLSRFALDITSNMVGYLPGQYNVVIDSETEPSAEDRSKLWHVRLAGGAPSGKIYSFYLGEWVTPHPIEPGSQMRMWWTGSEADAWSYDGGDGTDPSSNVPTATTGSFWEKDDDYDFRFPLQAGTSPAPYSTTVSPGDTGGEEKVILDADEMPNHGHKAFVATSNGISSNLLKGLQTTDETEDGGPTVPAYMTGAPGEDPFLESTGGDINGDTVGHQNMPPYKVGMWLKRTGRAYQTAGT